jgi:hypothetical protein
MLLVVVGGQRLEIRPETLPIGGNRSSSHSTINSSEHKRYMMMIRNPLWGSRNGQSGIAVHGGDDE